MSNTVIVRQNTIYTNTDIAMGFDKYEDGRFPGTKTGFPPFRFPNGTYRHGVPNGTDRTFIENALLNGESLDSDSGKQFLSDFLIELDNDISFLDKQIPDQLLRLYCILAAKDMVASSRKEAKANTMSPRMYVIEEIGENEKEKLTIKQKVNKARAKLSELETEPDYMLALTQYIAPNNAGIKNTDNAYLFLDDLLNGKYTDDSEQMGVNRFESALNQPKEVIFVSALVKEAIYKNVIRKEGGIYINPSTKTSLGRKEEEVVNFLLQDNNQEELGMGLPTDKPYSIRTQLKNKSNYKLN